MTDVEETKEPSKLETWIDEFKTSEGKEAIDGLKDITTGRSVKDIKLLKQEILKACYWAKVYEKKRDVHEIARINAGKIRIKIPNQVSRIEKLVSFIKSNKNLADTLAHLCQPKPNFNEK